MTATSAAGVTQEYVLSQVRAARDKNQMPTFHFTATQLDGEVAWRSICYIARARDRGLAGVTAFFEEFADVGMYAFRACEVAMESSRGRRLGSGAAMLVDAPWEGLDAFRRATALRGGAGQQQLLKFTFSEQFCKPNRESTIFAAESWITEAMDEDTAVDYASCDDAPPEPAEVPTAEQPDQVQSLLKRIQELESRAPPAAPHAAIDAAAPDGLLGQLPKATPAPRPEMMQRLQMMAGAGPSRFAQHERADRALVTIPEDAGPLEMALQEQEREVVADAEVAEILQAQLEEFQDPMHRLMMMQMKQMALMNQQLMSRQPQDAIHAALGQSNEQGGGSTSGIKGCLAQEAYVKIAANLVQFQQVVQSNALQELGLGAQQAYPRLLRDYLEKRIPLGAFKLLTQVGYLMAHAYEVGARTGNLELQGLGAKGMVFVEQTALDEGRTSLSWLLTALPEPNFAQVQLSRAKSSGIAANVGYLRDLDFLETKIRASDKNASKLATAEAKPKTEPKKWPKRKKGKGEEPSSEASASV